MWNNEHQWSYTIYEVQESESDWAEWFWSGCHEVAVRCHSGAAPTEGLTEAGGSASKMVHSYDLGGLSFLQYGPLSTPWQMASTSVSDASKRENRSVFYDLASEVGEHCTWVWTPGERSHRGPAWKLALVHFSTVGEKWFLVYIVLVNQSLSQPICIFHSFFQLK